MLTGNMFWWISIGFLSVVLVFALLLLALLLIRDLRRPRVCARLKHLADRMHEAEQRFEPIRDVREQYEPTDPPPFAETVADLCETVTWIKAFLHDAHTRYASVHAHVQSFGNHPAFALRRLQPWMPRTEREIAALAELLNDIERQLSNGERLRTEIQQKPRQTRDKCAALGERMSDIGAVVAKLAQAGFQDTKFTEARNEAERLRGEVEAICTRIQTLPPALLTKLSTMRISNEHKQVIAAIEQQCVDIENRVTDCERIFRIWNDHDGRIQEHIEQARQNLDEAETATAQLACCIKDLDIITAKTKKIRNQMEGLENNYRKPDVNHLTDMLAIAGKLAEGSQAHVEAIAAYLADLTMLRETIVQNQADFEDRHLRIDALSKGLSPRVTPTRTAAARQQIAAAHRALGGPDDQRLLGELSSQTQSAKQIQKDLHGLATQLDEIETAHAQLITLRTQADSTLDWDLWASAHQLAAQIAPYDPANWPDELRVVRIAADAEKLVSLQSMQLEPALHVDTIADDAIVQLAKDSEQVLEERRAFAERYKAITWRLSEIEASLSHAQHIFVSTQKALGRLNLDSQWRNSVEAVAAPLVQLFDLRERGGDIERALANLRHGTIDEKRQRVEVWTARCYEYGNQLQQALIAAGASLAGQIQTMLEHLQSYASFHNQDEVRNAYAWLQPPATAQVYNQPLDTVFEQAVQAAVRYAALHQAHDALGKIISRVKALASRAQQWINEADAKMRALYQCIRTVEETWACEFYDKNDLHNLTSAYENLKNWPGYAWKSDTIESYQHMVANTKHNAEQIVDRAQQIYTYINEQHAQLSVLRKQLLSWMSELRAYAAEPQVEECIRYIKHEMWQIEEQSGGRRIACWQAEQTYSALLTHANQMALSLGGNADIGNSF